MHAAGCALCCAVLYVCVLHAWMFACVRVYACDLCCVICAVNSVLCAVRCAVLRAVIMCEGVARCACAWELEN